MPVIMQLAGDADGNPLPADGQFLMDFDFEFDNGIGEIRMTDDPDKAKQFADLKEQREFWLTSPKCRPLRPDGEPNRPLTSTNWIVADVSAFAPLVDNIPAIRSALVRMLIEAGTPRDDANETADLAMHATKEALRVIDEVTKRAKLPSTEIQAYLIAAQMLAQELQVRVGGVRDLAASMGVTAQRGTIVL
jgi:hypothetical protein